MVSSDLDDDLKAKVIIKKGDKPQDPIIFSKLAKVGLNNFYENN